jgi:hypothetical protein
MEWWRSIVRLMKHHQSWRRVTVFVVSTIRIVAAAIDRPIGRRVPSLLLLYVNR